jgi:hypothetical protein
MIDRLLRRPRALGVILCYNDADILEDTILHLLNNKHQIIAWDHGSTDNTSDVLDKYEHRLLERKFIPRSFDFYRLYPEMSKNIIDNYAEDFDWVSWPDQDEMLEGPKRDRTYYDYITTVFRSKYNWIRFNNFNYWFTEKDDDSIKSPVNRIKHYSIFPNCAPRIRSWRAAVTNVRQFNHNRLDGERYPEMFNIRHYPMRSHEQMLKRINVDRAGLKRGNMNVHYENMKQALEKLSIRSEDLIYDDGKDLNHTEKFSWDGIYFGK